MENIKQFKQQVADDIALIKADFSYRDRYNDDNYVFNHWILEQIYNLDEDALTSNITDQSGDCEIDCFYHYKEDKKLYIIQNKYYNNSTLTLSQIKKFISDPILSLDQGNFPNKDLQEAYNIAKTDNEYQIFIRLYSMEDSFSDKHYSYIKQANNDSNGLYIYDIYTIEDLYKIYYNDEIDHVSAHKFVFSLKNIDNSRLLDFGKDKAINTDKFKAKYIAVSVTEIYNLRKAAKDENYNLFDENIRNYLGNSRINRQIRDTLKNPNDRQYFFFYNNGITITVSNAKELLQDRGELKAKSKSRHYKGDPQMKEIVLDNPQIINGCQTVNSIYEVLNNDSDNIDDYQSTFVLLKILYFQNDNDERDRDLYRKIVESTNNQNAVRPSDFAKNNSYFEKIQDNFAKRGALLEVRKSDKKTFADKYNNEDRSKMLQKLNINFNTSLSKEQSVFSLEKLILVYLCHMKDGQAAYTKKNEILKPNSDYFRNYALRLNNLTYDTLIRIYCLYIKIEIDKKIELKDPDGQRYIPYYMFSLYSLRQIHLLS